MQCYICNKKITIFTSHPNSVHGEIKRACEDCYKKLIRTIRDSGFLYDNGTFQHHTAVGNYPPPAKI